MRGARKQQGWVGLVALLLAFLVVGLLATTALKQYGIDAGSGARSKTDARVDPTQGSAASPSGDAAGTALSPRDAMARARGLGDTVRQQASELDRRIDDASKK